MKKIKVAHIVPMLSPGGAERVAVHIVRRLDRQRYEPVVISFTRRLGCDLDRMLEEAGVEVRYLGKRPGFDYRMYFRLHPVLRDCQPDIVHTHLHVLRYALPFLLLLKRVSLLHTVHNLAEREIEPRARWIQRYALNHGVVPVAVAKEVALSLERLYGIQRCRVISNGIPTDSYACPQTPRREWRTKERFGTDDILFVCVARFAPQKNHSLLLKAFAQGPASDPKAHLVLVGEGVLREQLEEQAAFGDGSNGLWSAYREHSCGGRGGPRREWKARSYRTARRCSGFLRRYDIALAKSRSQAALGTGSSQTGKTKLRCLDDGPGIRRTVRQCLSSI